MNIILFTQYYIDNNEKRQKEFDYCLEQNINNQYIDHIYLINESEKKDFGINKITSIPYKKRPTYKDFFEEANKISSDDDIVILSNSDIYFNDTINLIKNIKNNEIYALLRWELTGKDGLEMYKQKHKKPKEKKPGTYSEKGNSQDVWIWKGKMNIDKIKNCNFHLGIPGCDNRIAHEFKNAGYKVKNPSKTIQSIHVHDTKKRNYTQKDRIKGPYHSVKPHFL